jgi:hypothetical protein
MGSPAELLIASEPTVFRFDASGAGVVEGVPAPPLEPHADIAAATATRITECTHGRDMRRLLRFDGRSLSITKQQILRFAQDDYGALRMTTILHFRLP